MKLPPCKGCTKRHPGCHAKCEDYQGWKAERDALIQKDRAIRYAQHEVDEQLFESYYKSLRRRGRKR